MQSFESEAENMMFAGKTKTIDLVFMIIAKNTLPVVGHYIKSRLVSEDLIDVSLNNEYWHEGLTEILIDNNHSTES